MARVLLSWICYWAGDAVSRVDRAPAWEHWGYPTYNRLMTWADDLQGNDPRCPWSPSAE